MLVICFPQIHILWILKKTQKQIKHNSFLRDRKDEKDIWRSYLNCFSITITQSDISETENYIDKMSLRYQYIKLGEEGKSNQKKTCTKLKWQSDTVKRSLYLIWIIWWDTGQIQPWGKQMECTETGKATKESFISFLLCKKK